MILELRNKKPFIHFGFNLVSKNGFTNEDIDVWLNTLYNQEVYNSFTITSVGANITKVNNYHYKLTYNSIGNKTISLQVQDVSKNITLNSNILNLEILSYKADTTKLTSDNTLITSDYF